MNDDDFIPVHSAPRVLIDAARLLVELQQSEPAVKEVVAAIARELPEFADEQDELEFAAALYCRGPRRMNGRDSEGLQRRLRDGRRLREGIHKQLTGPGAVSPRELHGRMRALMNEDRYFATTVRSAVPEIRAALEATEALVLLDPADLTTRDIIIIIIIIVFFP